MAHSWAGPSCRDRAHGPPPPGSPSDNRLRARDARGAVEVLQHHGVLLRREGGAAAPITRHPSRATLPPPRRTPTRVGGGQTHAIRVRGVCGVSGEWATGPGWWMRRAGRRRRGERTGRHRTPAERPPSGLNALHTRREGTAGKKQRTGRQRQHAKAQFLSKERRGQRCPEVVVCLQPTTQEVMSSRAPLGGTIGTPRATTG